jgi:IS5 family transposase
MRAYFHLPYRQTQGVVIAHANKVPNTPHYSTISRRINILEIKIHNEKLGNDIVIALDSTGIKVANRGEWMRHKWHVRKGYLKIHITVDIKNKRILSLEVTSEEIHDGKILKKLVDDASENNKIKRVLADGMYDSNKNFRYLSKNHIKSGIKTRSNSKARTCIARRLIRVKISYIYVTIIRIKDRGNWTLTHSYSCCYLVIFFLFILAVEKSTQTVV